jgi:hypothetical protein
MAPRFSQPPALGRADRSAARRGRLYSRKETTGQAPSRAGEGKSAAFFKLATFEKDALRFFIGLDVAIDQIRDIVVIFLFFLKESVVGGVIAKIHIVIHDRRHLLVSGLGVFERNDLSSCLRQFSFFILGDRNPRSGAGRGRRLEGRPAFGTKDRISVQIEKLRAAILALALAAEFRFGQLWNSPVVGPGNGQDGQWYRTVGLFARRVAVNPLSRLIASPTAKTPPRTRERRDAFQRSSSESQ